MWAPTTAKATEQHSGPSWAIQKGLGKEIQLVRVGPGCFDGSVAKDKDKMSEYILVCGNIQ